MVNSANSHGSPQSHRYLMIVWYLGTNFHGSQRQPHLRTVEGEIIYALKQAGYISNIVDGNVPDSPGENFRDNAGDNTQDNESKTGSEIAFFNAGMRTDKGVHAREYSFCFTASKPLYPRLIAATLPSDIGLVRYSEVPLTFNPRWECLWKEYHYYYPTSKEMQSSLDISIIEEALAILQGTYDFQMFSKTDRTRRDKYPLRTIDRASLLHDEGGLIFVFRSRAFSWEQIRRTVHFLINLGLHEYSLEDLKERLQSDAGANKTLKKSPPFPAEGLLLWQVEYPDSVVFTSFDIWIQPQEKHLVQSQVFHLQNAHVARQIHKNMENKKKSNFNPKNILRTNAKDRC
ncbi:MAG: tRNA pseudouridine synthase A [Promethearchaeota archaeon]